MASFFVSRVDTEVDARLEKIGTPEALELRGTAAIANARLAYEAYEQVLATDRWKALAASGARVQRPLWASTGVKNPEYPDTRYVDDLVAPDTVNTMPEKTLEAVLDHGQVGRETVRPYYAQAHEAFARLAAVGIDLADVVRRARGRGRGQVRHLHEEPARVAAGRPDAGRRAGTRARHGLRWAPPATRCGTRATAGSPGSPVPAAW